MDDRDLEARLRTHLHRRFDAAEPAPELVASVQQLLTTSPGRVGLIDSRPRRMQWGLGFGAAVAIVAVVLLVASSLSPSQGPGGSATVPPPTAGPVERNFLVLPPTAARPAKDVTLLAGDVLSARLRAVGIGTFSSGAGDVMFFVLPNDGPVDDAVRALLAAPGEVTFVGLPPSDYGSLVAQVGKPLPKAEPALFGWDGVAGATLATGSGRPTLSIELTASGTSAFATYSAAHIMEQVAIVIDGTVAVLATIQAPITDGVVVISGASDGDHSYDHVNAILAGGELPEAWRGASVPPLISRNDAAGRAMDQSAGATLHELGLNGEVIDGAWRAVWNVELDGSFPINCRSTGLRPGTCPPPATTELVKLDAVTGAVILTKAPAPLVPTE